MCGIFGLIRHADAAHPERATAAFVELGKLAVERGTDSAGFALVAPEYRGQTTPTVEQVLRTHTQIDNVTIVKDTCSFPDLWTDRHHLPLLARHRIALGHTRWATQGKTDDLANTSPLLCGALVGTHNGDLDKSSVVGRWALPRPVGSTDTETLYRALNRDRLDRRNITRTLREVEGRAALAWVDRTKPDRVYLARAALSPLATAYDAEGNLYWASNPRWFRDVDRMFNGGLGFHKITLVREGSLLTVSVADAMPIVEDVRTFTPTCRARDARMSDTVVWRGFDAADAAADKAQARRNVAKAVWTPATTNPTGSKTVAVSTPQPDRAPASDAWLDSLHDAAASLWDEEFDTIAASEAGEEWAHDEALSAMDRWLSDGGDEATANLVRQASLPSEVENVMVEFDLSSRAAFDKFRTALEAWTSTPTH